MHPIHISVLFPNSPCSSCFLNSFKGLIGRIKLLRLPEDFALSDHLDGELLPNGLLCTLDSDSGDIEEIVARRRRGVSILGILEQSSGVV